MESLEVTSPFPQQTDPLAIFTIASRSNSYSVYYCGLWRANRVPCQGESRKRDEKKQVGITASFLPHAHCTLLFRMQGSTWEEEKKEYFSLGKKKHNSPVWQSQEVNFL